MTIRPALISSIAFLILRIGILLSTPLQIRTEIERSKWSSTFIRGVEAFTYSLI
jgi:hypothetical protein